MISKQKIKIIVGLGNPGDEYSHTYHNAGRLALDYLLKKYADGITAKKKPSFLYYKTPAYIFIEPITFMNESGMAVQKALTYFKMKPIEMIVLHDDSDILLGKQKIVLGGGSAGHRGIESIIHSLGTKDFWRGRIGIRDSAGKASSFVLKKIPPTKEDALYGVFGEIEKVIENETP